MSEIEKKWYVLRAVSDAALPYTSTIASSNVMPTLPTVNVLVTVFVVAVK